jgi:oligoendopeptidase F
MAVTTRPDVAVPAPRFVAAGFAPSDLPALRSHAERLLARPLRTPPEAEEWLVDLGELRDRVRAGHTRRSIATTCDTADAAARERFLSYEREVMPEWRRQRDRLIRRYLESGGRGGLGDRYAVLDRKFEADVALYREENEELLVRDSEMRTEYAAIAGGRTVELGGETMTPQRCRGFLEEPDRERRRAAYSALVEARLRDRERLEDLFDGMLGVRVAIAANADCADFREWSFRGLHRFDYTPRDCATYHDAVERRVVPAVSERMQERRGKLRLDRLRPWDLALDPSGRPPLRPFSDEAGLVALGRALFSAVDPRFGREFDILVRNGLLDLMSRPGKAPGGYNTRVADLRLPFVFMNAVGRHEDVRTLLHEGGHAFHTLAYRDEPVSFLQAAPTEFCEVASMSMELLGFEHLGRAYGPMDARAALRRQLEGVLLSLCWVATIDAFQHWIYTNPSHTRAEREARWCDLRARFAPEIDWSGLGDARATEWLDQLHLFRHPFYYIEYGIAELGAVQVWRNWRRDPRAAVETYRGALALGDTRPLPGLFAAAGARFGMDEDVIAPVVDAALARLSELR